MEKLMIYFGMGPNLRVKRNNQYTEIWIEKNFINKKYIDKVEKISHLDSNFHVLEIINNIVSEDKYGDIESLVLDMPDVFKVNINKFENLKHLELHSDNFGNMSIVGFEELKELHISGNIHHSKIDFRSLSDLEALCLTGNNITEIPLEILNLRRLESLNLFKCHLVKLPEVIIEMPYLKDLNIKLNEFENLEADLARINWKLYNSGRTLKIYYSELVGRQFTNLSLWN